MSFYNVTNPTSFSVVSNTRFMLTKQGKLTRVPNTAKISAAITLTAEQLVAGNLICGGSAYDITMPSATDLITLLMGPAGFDISTSDVFTFRVQNTASGTVRILPGTDGTGSAISITSGSMKFINFQITISTVAGVTTYSYALL